MASPATWIQKFISKFGISVEQPAKFGTHGEKDDGGIGHVGLINPHVRAFNGMLQELGGGDGLMIFGEAGEAPNIVAPSGAVTVDKDGVFTLEPGAVAEAAIADGSITTDKLVNEAVTSDKIAYNAVGNNQLADNAVDTAEIVDGAITNQKITNATIQAAKLAQTYIQRVAGAASPESGNAAIDGKFTAAQLAVLLSVASAVGLEIKAAASQTGDLLRFKNNAGTVLWSVSADGSIDFMGITLNNCNITNLSINGHLEGEGSTFPTSPAAGDIFKHTGIEGGMKFERVGSEWLSVERFYTGINVDKHENPDLAQIALPKYGVAGISGHRIENLNFNWCPGDPPASGGDYWNIVLYKLDGSGFYAITPTSGTPDTSNGTTLESFYNRTLTYNAVVASPYHSLLVSLTPSGAGQDFINFHALITGRYVGVNP